MFRKIVVLLAALLVSVAAFAGNVAHSASSPDSTASNIAFVGHAYFGFGMGVDSMHAKGSTSTQTHDTFNVDNLVGTTEVASKANIGDDGWQGEIFEGYGMTFANRYYMGAEVFGSMGRTQTKANWSGNYSVDSGWGWRYNVAFSDAKKIDMKYNYGIALLPGINLSPNFRLYGRAAWVRANFDIHDSVHVKDFAGPSVIYDFVLSGSHDSTVDGVQFGIGSDYSLSKKWGLRAEYDWTRFGGVKMSMQKQFDDPYNNIHHVVTHAFAIDHFINNQFKLSLVYRFI